MKPPFIGRAISLAVLVGCMVWWGVRVTSGHPAEPKGLFPAPTVDAKLVPQPAIETAVIAGGCFWGMQGVFQHVKGVTSAISGYSGGTVENPYYQLVSSGSTGHAESVQVTYDSSQITYGKLLMIFFSVAHDPTQKKTARSGHWRAISFGDFLWKRRAEKNCRSVCRANQRDKGLRARDRY